MHSFSLPCFQSQSGKRDFSPLPLSNDKPSHHHPPYNSIVAPPPPSFIYPFFIVLFFRKRVSAARVWKKRIVWTWIWEGGGEERGYYCRRVGVVWLCERRGRRDIWVNRKVVFYVGNHEMWRASNEVDGSRIAFSIVIKSMKPWNCFSFLFSVFLGGNVLSLLLHSSRGGRGRGHRIAKSTELKKEEGEEEEELVR